VTSFQVTEKVAEFCQKHALLDQRDKIVVGVSGGPDSLCLLHYLVHFRSDLGLDLTIAHLNHQLRGSEAQADEAFVRDVAARWQVPIRVEAHDVAALAAERKQSLEEAARQVRYAFLWRTAGAVGAGKIAVGHNADDQIETVLMHFLRGTGLAGLRGMLPLTDIAGLRLHPDDTINTASPAPKLIRPLLAISRAEIETYCQAHDLAPRQDYSNQDVTFFRNRLRHELIPLLETYNPNIRQVLRRTANVVAADFDILQADLEQAWRRVIRAESLEKIGFDLAGWLALPLALKRSTLRRAIQSLRHSLRDISFEHVEQAITIVQKGQTGTQATLPQGLKLTVDYHRLLIAPENRVSVPEEAEGPYLAKGQVILLNLPGVSAIPRTNWRLISELMASDSLPPQQLDQVGRWETYLDAEVVGHKVVLRTRQPGDRFQPLGLGGHSQRINEFMINEKIPAGLRDHIPLLVGDNRILWVGGYRPDERARVRPTTNHMLHLSFEKQ
jgi:tRNA(Ile)-lysidine synthase